MNIGEILVANGAGLFLLVIMFLCRNMAKRTPRTVDRIFTVMIIIGIAGTILEPLTFMLDGRGGAFLRAVNIFANSLEFALTATVSVFWVWYVALSLNYDVKKLKSVFLPMLAIWALLIILLIGNVFGSFLFSVDENNVYARQPLGYIFYVFLIGSYLTSLVLYYRFRAAHGKALFFPIWMFLAPLFASIIIQIPFYGISVTFLGCSIGLVSIYLNMLSKKSLVDGLTGLYNRAYVEHLMITARHSKRYVYGGIMIDIDSFKKINDTYGHSAGDDALINAGKILIKAVDRGAVAFRFAGDEFIVLVRSAVSKAEKLETEMTDTEKRIRAGVEEFNSSGKTPYKLSFSMGHAPLDTKLPDDDFFRSMDTEMYKEKQLHHEAAGK